MAAPEVAVPGGVITKRGAEQAFTVHLDNFEGPFDLLLGLISKHQLDITEIALAKVTDEFMAHMRALQASEPSWDLGQTSEFLLVAATLLDIKAARLLPSTGDGDEEDLELIEARDLLFARLLQYRAFKDVARFLGETMAATGRMTARQAGLEPHLAKLLPELVISVTPEQLAMVAARALTPKEPETVGLAHLHAPAVSVREQAALVVERLTGELAEARRSVPLVGLAVRNAELRRLADQVMHREEGKQDLPKESMVAALDLIAYYQDMVAERRKERTEDLTSALIDADYDAMPRRNGRSAAGVASSRTAASSPPMAVAG